MRLPLRMMLGGALLVAVAAAGALAVPRESQAGVVQGEFSMQADITATTVSTGNTFTVDVYIEHDGAIPYQAAQWYLDYDETLVVLGTISPISSIRDSGAPGNCAQASNNGSRLLLGCVDILGPNLTYSGAVWHVPFQCNEAGVASFGLGTVGTQTWVKLDVGGTLGTVHPHTDSVTCSGASVPTNTPVPPTNTPVPPTATNTAVPTKTLPPPPESSPTRAPRIPFTETPAATDTATAAATQPPAGGGGSPAATATSPSGTVRPGGVLIGPDTGTGPQDGSSMWLMIILGGMAAAGAALFGAGAVAARRSR